MKKLVILAAAAGLAAAASLPANAFWGSWGGGPWYGGPWGGGPWYGGGYPGWGGWGGGYPGYGGWGGYPGWGGYGGYPYGGYGGYGYGITLRLRAGSGCARGTCGARVHQRQVAASRPGDGLRSPPDCRETGRPCRPVFRLSVPNLPADRRQ